MAKYSQSCPKFTAWSFFQQILGQEDFINATNEEEIEDCKRVITTIIQKAAWQSTPKAARRALSFFQQILGQEDFIKAAWQSTPKASRRAWSFFQ